LESLDLHSRLGVIGDIHTEAEVLAWALDVLHEQGVERILCTGDVADGPHHAEGVMQACKLLHAANVLTVQGNHDRWLLDNDRRDFPDATFLEEVDAPTRAYLQALPRSIEIPTPLGVMLFAHGLGEDDMAGLYPHDHGPALTSNAPLQNLIEQGRYPIVLSGHTHRRMVRKLDGITFINAGAIKATREPCCLLLDFARRRAEFFDYVEDGASRPGPEYEL
jgi:putative phosphoesterase